MWKRSKPLHGGCDRCASLVRPQNRPTRRWKHNGCQKVAEVVQGWHRGRSDLAMNAMVVVKFSAYSKQSHEGRRGGRSLIGRSKEAGGRHTHRHSRRMDAQGSAIGRPVKKCVLLSILYINLSDYSASFLPLLCLPWPINSVHWAITVATTVPPFGDHGNPWATMAMALPPILHDLLCHYSSLGGSMHTQRSYCSSYTETERFGFGRPLSVLVNFLVAQRWHEGRSPV